jgi:hypothetical protein
MNISLSINKNTRELEVTRHSSKGQFYCSLPIGDDTHFVYVAYGWSTKQSDLIPVWICQYAKDNGVRISQVRCAKHTGTKRIKHKLLPLFDIIKGATDDTR